VLKACKPSAAALSLPSAWLSERHRMIQTTETCTEDQLVEQPAIGLFAELGWTTVSALEELFGRSRGDETHSSPAGSQSLLTSSPTVCLGRETKGDVVLVSRLPRCPASKRQPVTSRCPAASDLRVICPRLTDHRQIPYT
jgi:hypothetical protein